MFLARRSLVALAAGVPLFLVWSQGRTGYLMDGSFDYGRDVRGLFDSHPQNVFLVKFSYCFQL